MKNSEQPAFPVSKESCEISEITEYPFGITKREYFAALAMQGLLANGMTTQEGVQPPYTMELEKLAKLCVDNADALLLALSIEVVK